MSELGVLFLVARCPHRVTLARRVRDSSLFPAFAALRSLRLAVAPTGPVPSYATRPQRTRAHSRRDLSRPV